MHRSPDWRTPLTVSVLAASAVLVVVAGVRIAVGPESDGVASPVAAPGTPTEPAPTETPSSVPTTPPPVATPTPTDDVGPAAPALAGHGAPYGAVDGLTMFRGNPTRSWYGRGLPDAPEVAWQFPAGRERLCSESTAAGGTKEWCGTGWTGQPVVWDRPDGTTEVIVGAYDRQVHFLDAATGLPSRPAFRTGDLVKGSVTLDPDGFPLLYVGSRDDRYRVLALDRDVPTELFALTPHSQGVWNDDWDGNGVVVDGVLLLGGEDSWFRAVDLRRAIGTDGLVTVDPVVLAEVPGWDDELIAGLGDWNVSIESSPLVVGDTVYVVNSGGLVSGFDTSRVRDGELPRTFRYWLGDDADATLVAGPDGILYAAVELERGLPRAREVGQLVALDPARAGDPRLWGVAVPPRPEIAGDDGGIWATPAIHGDHLYVTTHPGDLLVVDRHTGEVVHAERVGYHEWSSPVVVDDTLLLGLCDRGRLRAYDLTDPTAPATLWEARVPTGGCIESTPAVWDGGVYVGSRDGHVYGFRADGGR
jgi:outer membrane protein assembly factor BamB